MEKVIVVVGPTAVGKTALSIELAKKYQGEVMLQRCSLFPLFCQKSKNQKNNSTHITD